MTITADRGGGLVYQLGVAVARHQGEASAPSSSRGTEAEVASAAAASAADPAARLEIREDGAVVWRPAPRDAAALGTILEVASGAAIAAVHAVDPDAGDSKGLTLEVEGRTLLTLPGTFGDVEVAAVVDLTGFSGTFGLAHHVRDAAAAGLLSVRPADGVFTLVTLRGDREPKVLDQASAQLPSGPIELAVTAAGRHLRGTLAGQLVVHGHEPALPDGGAGILVDGAGPIRIERLVVTPIDP